MTEIFSPNKIVEAIYYHIDNKESVKTLSTRAPVALLDVELSFIEEFDGKNINQVQLRLNPYTEPE